MIATATIPFYMRYTKGAGEEQGLLVDERENLLIRLNQSGCRAWEAYRAPTWPESCRRYSEAEGIELSDATDLLVAFGRDLAQHGWLEFTEDALQG